MIRISIQFFGGRGSGGGKGGGGGGSSAVPWDTSHSARQDFYSTGNFRTLGGTKFSQDVSTVKEAPVGSTARIRYPDNSEVYARKTGESSWKTDSGQSLSNNDIASAADPTNDGKVRLNTMVKRKK